MPDEPPLPPPSDSPKSTGLPSNIAAALACIPLVGGIVLIGGCPALLIANLRRDSRAIAPIGRSAA